MSHKTPPTTVTPAITASHNGRESNGRFADGNRGGPGNPFARQVAALRKALINAVTEKDLADIVRVLIVRATSGDVAAARLVLSYAIGKPAAAPNPDRMNVDEAQQIQADRDIVVNMRKLTSTPELEMPMQAVRLIRASLADEYCNRMRQGLKDMDAADKERQMAMAEANRSTNGTNGDLAEPELGGMPTQRVGMTVADATQKEHDTYKKAVPSPNGKKSGPCHGSNGA
jgi:hypothetical protein